MSRRAGMFVLLAGLTLAGCPNKSSDHTAAAPPASASSGAVVAAAPPERVAELRRAEDTRTLSAVRDADLSSGDPQVRRAAVRALARADRGEAREKLLAALADADPDVLSWAAYGLGRICAWDRERTSRRLATRGAALGVEPTSPAGRLDPWFSLAWAMGRCASQDAERTLVAWLNGPKARSVAAADGLGAVVTRHKRMEEETAAALLRATRGDAANDPLSEALYPFGRLSRAPVRVEDQLLEAARSRLGHAGPARVFVFRALGTLEGDAVSTLGEALGASTGYTAAEQAEAARALGKIRSKEAEKQLLSAIEKLAPPNEAVALTSLVGPGFGTLMTALGAVHVPAKRRLRSKGLDALLALEPPPGAPKPVVRRVGLLRCAAARLTSGSSYDHPSLTACDPEGGQAGALARLAVLDRGDLEGARFRAWKDYLDPKQPLAVRESALRMISSHPELRSAAATVAKALEDEHAGVVAEAATVVAAHPDRFLIEAKGKDKDAKPKADPAVSKALQAAIKKAWPPDAIEMKGALARASGALGIEQARSWIDGLCVDPNPTLRQHASKALAALGVKKPVCEAKPDHPYEPASELGHLINKAVRIELDTDVGKLTIELEPDLAPVAATRIADLVHKKFYDDMAVHRVVPGFVVQFGDRGGDGYGGAGEGLDALRCETSPVPFETGVVGIALGGRDTGSSQLFVTLGPAPHLDGEYAVIGKATGEWAALTEGDRIRTARIEKGAE